MIGGRSPESRAGPGMTDADSSQARGIGAWLSILRSAYNRIPRPGLDWKIVRPRSSGPWWTTRLDRVGDWTDLMTHPAQRRPPWKVDRPARRGLAGQGWGPCVGRWMRATLGRGRRAPAGGKVRGVLEAGRDGAGNRRLPRRALVPLQGRSRPGPRRLPRRDRHARRRPPAEPDQRRAPAPGARGVPRSRPRRRGAGDARRDRAADPEHPRAVRHPRRARRAGPLLRDPRGRRPPDPRPVLRRRHQARSPTSSPPTWRPPSWP